MSGQDRRIDPTELLQPETSPAEDPNEPKKPDLESGTHEIPNVNGSNIPTRLKKFASLLLSLKNTAQSWPPSPDGWSVTRLMYCLKMNVRHDAGIWWRH